MGSHSVETRSLQTKLPEHAGLARVWLPWAQQRALVVMVREARRRKPPKLRRPKAWPTQSDSAWADGVPEPEALLGGNPEYDASLEQLLLLSAQFQELLDKRQTQKWLQLEDAFLRHFALVQNAFYLAGRERTQAQARKEMRALVVELLASYVETQTALRAQSFGAAYSGAAYSGAGRPRAGGCDGRCIDMANALSRLLR